MLTPTDTLLQELTATEYQKIVSGYANSYLKRSNFNHQHINTDKIKLGLLSSDFNQHPVGFLLYDLFQYFPKNLIEIYCYYKNDIYDYVTNNITQQVTKFIPCHNLDSDTVAELIYQDKLNLLIDLQGYTGEHNLAILANRPAPLQAHWLGYPTSLGANYIDYYITSIYHANGLEAFFNEKLALLPTSIIEPSFSLAIKNVPCRLPKEQFIFCNFSPLYRINNTLIELWSTILQQAPNSILWLRGGNNKYLQEAFNAYGIKNKRLHFFNHDKLSDFWPQLQAHAWLDTIAMTSGTACAMALQAGLPFITIKGAIPQQRIASSFLEAKKLSSYLAFNKKDYVSKALKLYNDWQHGNYTRQKVAFNPQLFANNFTDLITKLIL